jgi:hypothetical protein
VYHNATLFAGVENILDTNTAHFLLELMLGRNIYGDFDTTFKRVFLKIKIPVCKNRNFLFYESLLSNGCCFELNQYTS